jgi:hypothetical protein
MALVVVFWHISHIVGSTNYINERRKEKERKRESWGRRKGGEKERKRRELEAAVAVIELNKGPRKVQNISAVRWCLATGCTGVLCSNVSSYLEPSRRPMNGSGSRV